jgi:hypothetical protein
MRILSRIPWQYSGVSLSYGQIAPGKCNPSGAMIATVLLLTVLFPLIAPAALKAFDRYVGNA